MKTFKMALAKFYANVFDREEAYTSDERWDPPRTEFSARWAYKRNCTLLEQSKDLTKEDVYQHAYQHCRAEGMPHNMARALAFIDATVFPLMRAKDKLDVAIYQAADPSVRL